MKRTNLALAQRRSGRWPFPCALLLLALWWFGIAPFAYAQSVPPPATQNAIDGNGVDLIRGALFLQSPSASVGQPGAGGLVYQRTYDSSIQDWRDNVTGTINVNGSSYTVTLLGASETFTFASGQYTSTEGRGGTLTLAADVYTYTTASGAVAHYSRSLASQQPTQANEGRVTDLTLPSGERLTFTYTELRTPALPETPTFLAHRLQSVNNNLGYQLSFEYQSNTADATGIQLKKVTAINNAVDYCAPTANGCTGFTRPWMSVEFGYPAGAQTITATDPDGAGPLLAPQWRYAITSNRITGIRWPSSSSDDITVTYDGDGRVYQLSNAVGTWTYLYEDTGSTRQTSVVDPASHVRLFFSNLSISRITAFQDGVGNVTQYTYDSLGRLQNAFEELGNVWGYVRDSRGNLTQLSEVQNSIGGVPGAVINHYRATYPSSCSDSGVTIVTCNLPTSETDALGNTTNYTYDTTHGGLLTVTAPDPDGASPLPRPQTRYSYAQVTASYKQSSGASPTPASTSVWRLTQVSSCATSAWSGSACGAGQADETRTTITYGTNNQLPTEVESGTVDTSLRAEVTTTYDDIGNALTVDGPLSGDADTTRARYDNARRRVGVIGPDPDGAGALKHRALRFSYNQDGQVTAVERGTVNSQSDPDWSGFSSLETLSMAYDAVGRLSRESLVVSGVTQALTQYGYDNANKLQCTAVRMNMTPSVLAALPDACTLSTQGSSGPDRITRNIYDNADRIIQVQAGYGTSLVQTTMAQTFTANGMPATLTDANGNVTTYEYDGIDRLIKIRFPNASGGGSSTSDYAQFTYNANGLVTQGRLRDGGLVNFTYDNLSRVTLVDAPSGTLDVTSAYDNFSRLTQLAYSGTHTLWFGYDQLSRNTSVTRVADGATHVVGYQYDLAGRRTRMDWPDSFHVTYDYDLTGAMTAIRENGAASGAGVLAEFEYDNLGRRTSLQRADGAGVTTSYAYDAASRLASLQQDIAGTANDPNFTFTYNAAGQALSRTGNAAYAWPQPSISAVSYTANGRNQYASVGGTSFTYDARGNLTSTGAAAYGYDAFNRLTSAGSATLAYDPAGRLYQTTSNGSAVTARFLYDGLDAIAEYNGSNVLQRRYVHGPGFDEPIVEYVGSGTSDRRWLVTDQLGSVVALTNASGASISTNTYDEYGQPGSSNAGRFQYTGQVWIAEAGLYHYKARAYSPMLGRFLQTDPILYAGGMNLYRCVLNDPINLVDPLGLQEVDDGVITVVGGSVQHWTSEQVNNWLAAHVSHAPLPDSGELEEIVVEGKKKDKQVVRAGPINPCATLSPGFGPGFNFGNVSRGVTVEAFLPSPYEALNPETTNPGRFGPGRQSTNGPTTAPARGPFSPGSAGRARGGARGGAIAPTMGVVNFEIYFYPSAGGAEQIISGSVSAFPNVSTPVPVPTGPGFVTIFARPSTFSTADVLLRVCPR